MALLSWWFPPVCIGCGVLTRGGRWACRRCLTEHQPVPEDDAGAMAVAYYEGPVRRALVKLKFHGAIEIAGPLAEILGQSPQWRELANVDLIVPIPLHWSRLAQRGFNQSLLILRQAHRLWPRPPMRLSPRLLVRRRATRPQSTLAAAGRTANVAGAFAVPHAEKKNVQGQRIVVFDDVVTTGSTVGAATAALLDAGARSVMPLALARALA